MHGRLPGRRRAGAACAIKQMGLSSSQGRSKSAEPAPHSPDIPQAGRQLLPRFRVWREISSADRQDYCSCVRVVIRHHVFDSGSGSPGRGWPNGHSPGPKRFILTPYNGYAPMFHLTAASHCYQWGRITLTNNQQRHRVSLTIRCKSRTRDMIRTTTISGTKITGSGRRGSLSGTLWGCCTEPRETM
jgi:hypothetical protein